MQPALDPQIRQLQALLATLPPDVLAKATYGLSGSPVTGLTYYDLEEEAKVFVPEITPLVGLIPRVKGKGGTATNWQVITALNSDRLPMGVAEGARGGVMDIQTSRQTAPYATIGIESSLTFEQDLAAMGFEDMKALSTRNLLQVARIGEEALDVGGNLDVVLGTTPTVAGTPSNTGGTLTNAHGAYHVRCVALTLQAWRRATMVKGVPVQHTYTLGNGVSQTVNGGAAKVSADATVTIAAGTTGSADLIVTAVPGAVAYAWFAGDNATTTCLLFAITTVNEVLLTDPPGAIIAASGFATAVGTNFDTDRSTNDLVYNGLISIISKAGSGSYVKSLDNTKLTSDGAAGCVEVNTLLRTMWDTVKVTPTIMLMNAQELVDLSDLVVKNGGAPIIRMQMDANSSTPGMATITAGTVVGFYLNKTAQGGGQILKVILHPDIPPGMILFYSERISYPVPGVVNIIQVKTQEEWRQIEWPLVTREHQYGVYARQVLQCYYPPAFAMLYNIAPQAS